MSAVIEITLSQISSLQTKQRGLSLEYSLSILKILFFLEINRNILTIDLFLCQEDIRKDLDTIQQYGLGCKLKTSFTSNRTSTS